MRCSRPDVRRAFRTSRSRAADRSVLGVGQVRRCRTEGHGTGGLSNVTATMTDDVQVPERGLLVHRSSARSRAGRYTPRPKPPLFRGSPTSSEGDDYGVMLHLSSARRHADLAPRRREPRPGSSIRVKELCVVRWNPGRTRVTDEPRRPSQPTPSAASSRLASSRSIAAATSSAESAATCWRMPAGACVTTRSRAGCPPSATGSRSSTAPVTTMPQSRRSSRGGRRCRARRRGSRPRSTAAQHRHGLPRRGLDADFNPRRLGAVLGGVGQRRRSRHRPDQARRLRRLREACSGGRRRGGSGPRGEQRHRGGDRRGAGTASAGAHVRPPRLVRCGQVDPRQSARGQPRSMPTGDLRRRPGRTPGTGSSSS